VGISSNLQLLHSWELFTGQDHSKVKCTFTAGHTDQWCAVRNHLVSQTVTRWHIICGLHDVTARNFSLYPVLSADCRSLSLPLRHIRLVCYWTVILLVGC